MARTPKTRKSDTVSLPAGLPGSSLRRWVNSANSRLGIRKFLSWARAGADLVYPLQCAACGEQILDERASIALCGTCHSAIDALERPYCRRCGMGLGGMGVPSESSAECAACRDRRPRFTRVTRLGPYERELRSYVLRMKHATDEPLSLALGILLGRACELEFGDSKPDWIVPVPMYWRRRMIRRTSSAETLARAVGKQLRVKVHSRALSRTRNTPSQADLPPGQRRANVRGAFRLRRPALIADAHVLVVDDVLTTGATCNEIAGVLRRGGAREISVAVVARTEAPAR